MCLVKTDLFLPAQPHSVQDSKVEDSPVEDNTGREDEAATSVASAAWAVGAEVLLQKKSLNFIAFENLKLISRDTCSCGGSSLQHLQTSSCTPNM